MPLKLSAIKSLLGKVKPTRRRPKPQPHPGNNGPAQPTV